MTGTSFKDHDAFDLRITVAAPSIASRRLGMVQFRGKELNVAWINFRGYYSKIKRVISKSRGVLCQVFMGPLLD
jgi:hypothetical protein